MRRARPAHQYRFEPTAEYAGGRVRGSNADLLPRSAWLVDSGGGVRESWRKIGTISDSRSALPFAMVFRSAAASSRSRVAAMSRSLRMPRAQVRAVDGRTAPGAPGPLRAPPPPDLIYNPSRTDYGTCLIKLNVSLVIPGA